VSGINEHTGKAVVLLQDQIDTDRIIPARYLSRISRFGYGELLFKDVRGESFPLDAPEADGASILVVGTNFGCGSSREHAVWALQQAGFVAIIAREDPDSAAYSDIFTQNAANCCLLLVALKTDAHARLAKIGTGGIIKLNLAAQTVVALGETFSFEVNPATKQILLEGLDLIGLSLRYSDSIDRYEKEKLVFVPSKE